MRGATLGDVGGVKLSRVLCGCVGDENGVGASELTVDAVGVDADDGGNDNVDRRTNCPREFQNGAEASVNPL